MASGEGHYSLVNNPFLALFDSAPIKDKKLEVPDKKPPAPSRDIDLDKEKQNKSGEPRPKKSQLDFKKVDLSEDSVPKRLQSVNTAIEDIFAITLNPYGLLGRKESDPVRSNGLFLMESFALELQQQDSNIGRSWFDIDILGQALFERLQLSRKVIRKNVLRVDEKRKPGQHVIEDEVVHYLIECYVRCVGKQQALQRLSPKSRKVEDEFFFDDLKKMQKIIVQNLSTAFREPEIYFAQDLFDQLWDTLSDSLVAEETLANLLEELVVALKQDDSHQVGKKVIEDLLKKAKADIDSAAFIVMSDSKTRILRYFIQTPKVAKLFMLFNYPKGANPDGRSYMKTLLGRILSKSCLPEAELGRYDFFEEPSKQPSSVHTSTESRIWNGLDVLHDIVHDILKSLFKVNDEVKHLALMWIGDCFKANAGRGKMWTGQMGALLSNSLASDGFFLNLGAVLLKFCLPFTKGLANPKIMKIDPTYTSVKCVVSEDAFGKNIHLRDADKETFLIPATEEEKEADGMNVPYGFVTDLFFLTHKCLDLGFRVVHEKFVKLNQNLGRQQQGYREIVAREGPNSPFAETVHRKMEEQMTIYLSHKAALLVPSVIDAALFLGAATGSWMVQAALNTTSAKLSVVNQISFPLKIDVIPPAMKHIPEFVMENICENLLLVKRFTPISFEQNSTYLPPLMDFILTFMGSPKWVKNPHLRARLAECLECILPHEEEGPVNPLGAFHREQLFKSHPDRLELVPTLLHVFVDIETTGQAVEFEMKFSYRRPMYDVMKHVWKMDEYRQKFIEMAEHAEAHIEDEDAPLFLRFVNLLINDAIFLLDEALGFMKQIQEQQLDRERNWGNLTTRERDQREGELMHLGRLAKYHNLMGTETIQMLDRLSGAMSAVFTHDTMVDRIASMLNYFLKNLVGPNRKSFKVKNIEDFAFRPGEIVADITKIYINFKKCSTFLSAVSRDGRSYTPELFDQTEEVLFKVGKAELVTELREVARSVRKNADSQKADDELFSDAPDRFLDAIMSHLMKDPVQLPNSGQIVDRSTIARHLLSDQNDPFTRASLTMEQVVPLDDLRAEIESWMEEKRKATAHR